MRLKIEKLYNEAISLGHNLRDLEFKDSFIYLSEYFDNGHYNRHKFSEKGVIQHLQVLIELKQYLSLGASGQPGP